MNVCRPAEAPNLVAYDTSRITAKAWLAIAALAAHRLAAVRRVVTEAGPAVVRAVGVAGAAIGYRPGKPPADSHCQLLLFIQQGAHACFLASTMAVIGAVLLAERPIRCVRTDPTPAICKGLAGAILGPVETSLNPITRHTVSDAVMRECDARRCHGAV